MPLKPFLFNKTRKKALAQEGRVLRGFSMGLGAMFTGLRGKALVFVWWRPSRIAITNVFVPEAIDIAWLDEQWKVVNIHACFPSGAWQTVNKKPAKYVIELPCGTLKTSGTRTGDTILCKAFRKA